MKLTKPFFDSGDLIVQNLDFLLLGDLTEFPAERRGKIGKI